MTHSVAAIVSLFQTGEATAREIVAEYLGRIAQENGRINAITVVLAESALATADRQDQARRRGEPLGPLAGVPFTIKESLDCLGSATTYGLRGLRDARPYLDAPAVARLKDAGAIPIARTNLSELGMRLCADNPLRGRTQNPWDPRLTPGGSSGGDAAAVAIGMTPLGLGSDIGGSLRVPAACCGVAALKPTTGRVAHASSLPPEDFGPAGQLMLAIGPIAKTAGDLRLGLAAMAGRDRRDPRSVDAPLAGPPPDERRVALVTELADAPLEPGVRAAVERAGARLEAQGWIVEQACPPEILRVGEIWLKLLAADLAATLPLSEPVLSPALVAYLRRFRDRARLDEASAHRVHTERSRLQRAWSGFFAEYPVVLGPTLTTAPWPVDADLDGEDGLEMLARATRFVLPASALGLPAVSVPLPSGEGRPTNVEVLADLWREDLCLEVAETLEGGC